VVPNRGLFCLGGSTSATVGESSRRLRSRIMLSIGLRRGLNAMFRTYRQGCQPYAVTYRGGEWESAIWKGDRHL